MINGIVAKNMPKYVFIHDSLLRISLLKLTEEDGQQDGAEYGSLVASSPKQQLFFVFNFTFSFFFHE